MSKICCGFGHRNVFENIEGKLSEAILCAVENGCNLFYTGAMGDFDSMFASTVRKAKATNPNIKLICIKPYLTSGINENKDYYTFAYDDVIVPDELAGIHYKSAIKARNRWMVDMSEVVIGYTIRNYGGAYTALKYAESKGKTIISILPQE